MDSGQERAGGGRQACAELDYLFCFANSARDVCCFQGMCLEEHTILPVIDWFLF